MAKRFEYSRWDGTQTGFELDADAAFDELTDELLYHGDVNAALRRMMQEGMRDRDGDQLAGPPRAARTAPRRAPGAPRATPTSAASTTRSTASSTTSSTRNATRSTTPSATPRTPATSAAPRTPQAAADERNMRLDLMPDDLAGKVRELDCVQLRVGRGQAALRPADGAAQGSADAADGRPDVGRHAEHDPRATWPA